LFERALALDPRSVEAQNRLALALADRVLDSMTDTEAADIARAEELVRQALATSPRSPLAHYAKGELLRVQSRYEDAIPEFETALASNRNWVGAIAVLGYCKFYTGSTEEMIPAQEQALRLSPRDPNVGTWYNRIGHAYLLQSRTDEAIVWLERARIAIPATPAVHANLAAAYTLNGKSERAAAELAEARRLRGEGSYSSIARLRATGEYTVRNIRALFEATYFAGLRKAGVPEE
jgi:adenylate cyclase